jgi:hypothetical protein
MRKLALTLVLVATVLGAEVVARVLIDRRGFTSFHDERAAFLARLPLQDLSDDPAQGNGASVERVNGASFVLHPFFGYTYRASFAGTNGAGFYSGGPSFPYHAAPRELVVGIFGGSVAMQVAGARERIVAALEPLARARGYDRVTALSYAVGGWRQPQQFDALVRFVDDLDVAVVVDGFNEIIQLSDWHLRRQPAEYPWSAVYEMLARQPTAREELDRADLIRADVSAATTTRRLDGPVLRSSALAQLAWRVYAARYDAATSTLRDRLTRATVDREVETGLTAKEAAARRSAYLVWWAELIRFSQLIVHERGGLFFHFVQPNQYERGAKPLSPEERESFTRNTTWFDEVTPRYAYARRMTEQLRREGVDTTFLGELFATTRETVYVDDCCHLNARGIATLTDAIARHIVASDEIGRLAAAADRDAGRARAAAAAGAALAGSDAHGGAGSPASHPHAG